MKIVENSVRNRVKSLMALDQHMRDNDKELWLKIAEQDGLILTKAQRFIFMGVPSEAMVSRRRREFSRDFPASEAVTEKRYGHYKAITKEFSKQSWLVKILHKRRIV